MRTRRDLWVGFKPYGIGETKPNAYGEMARTVWENRRHLRYAWRILRKGVCDGCALGVAGFHDWTLSGVHLCTTRLNLLKFNTMDALRPGGARRRRGAAQPDGQGAARPRPARVPDDPPARRRRVPPRLVGRSARRGRRCGPRRGPGPARRVPDRPRAHQRELLRRAEGHPLPRQRQHRQRGACVPRAVDGRAQADAGRRRHDVFLYRRHRQRPHRAVRLERRQRAARLHEVPVPRAQARREGRRRQPAA